MTYSEKLKDPRWQRKRLEVMQRDSFACQSCGDESSTLQVHHSYYLPKWMPWQYPEDSLITLCEGCHEEQTSRIPRLMMQNKTPMQTMVNTELLECANVSGEVMGYVMELAFALKLSEQRNHMDAHDVMLPIMESLNKKMEEVAHAFISSIS